MKHLASIIKELCNCIHLSQHHTHKPTHTHRPYSSAGPIRTDYLLSKSVSEFDTPRQLAARQDLEPCLCLCTCYLTLHMHPLQCVCL